MTEHKSIINQGIIHKLSQEVINKIAAGEIVQRPYSVVKELVENSIDANSTQITVHMVGGGLDQIKIVDDGKGIHQDDFPLLCERFATSKISKAEDLTSLNSFGFRGEALASISYVSNVTITSKQQIQDFGYQALFKDSLILMRNDTLLQRLGCNDGTTIEVDQLFYNLQQRRSSTSKLEEKKSVLKLIQSLSMHYRAINFKLYLDKNNEYSSINNQTRQELIAQLTKTSPNSLFDLEIQSQLYGCECVLTYSKISSIKAKKELVLFINDRLVECDSVKRAIDRVYQSFYQCIHDELGGFYVYCSLKLQPNQVDPNVIKFFNHEVHPNKKEVRFINEQEISFLIEQNLTQFLQQDTQQKQYQLKQKQLSFGDDQFQSQPQRVIQPRQIIRTDPKTQTIDSFYTKLISNSQKVQSVNQQNNQIQEETSQQLKVEQQITREDNDQLKIGLLNLLRSKIDKESQEFIQTCVYVGCVTPLSILVQVKTKLLIINSVTLLFVYFINKIMNSLSEFNTTNIIHDQIQIKDKMITSKLESYFNISCDNGIVTFPQISEEPLGSDDIQSFFIEIQKIEYFNDEDWIFQVSKQLAEVLSFQNHALEQTCIQSMSDLGKVFSNDNRSQYDKWYRDCMMPYLKSKAMILNLDINAHNKELLSLEGIYSIFERC